MIADKIHDRPGLYLEHAINLMLTLGGNRKADMWIFNYVAANCGDTEENSAILEAEVRYRVGQQIFSVKGNQTTTLNSYFEARNSQYDKKARHKTIITKVNKMKKNKGGEWVQTDKKETRTFIIY